MQPKRWEEISQIFESALALAPEKRRAYITNCCAGDESLRREVEVLIKSHQRAESEEFINSPAVERMAPVLVADDSDAEQASSRLEKGEQVGHYKILGKLGTGGMGEVYLANDARLDRTVALKILPADVAADKRRMQRFKQEARIASALNHPNILTIFEFGEADNLDFIATEYVDGETLRLRLRSKHMTLLETIDVAIQVVSALDAAHEAKIVHRDIKPENIMLRRRDNIVKVLDFGLAKLTETKSLLTGQVSDTEAPTEFKSIPGTVLGTVKYMSPEQAKGLQVDERTDLWSVGAVIYEMVSGHVPFSGATKSHTVVEILERDPRPLSQSMEVTIPHELERIVNKALAKIADERYQTAKDMLIDLRSLRRQLDLEAGMMRSAAPDSSIPLPRDKTTSTGVSVGPNELGIEPPTRHTRKVAMFLVIATLISAVAIFAIYEWRTARSTVVPSSAPERRLNYFVTVQKYRNGVPYQEPFRLAREINFEKDYRIRLNLSSSQSGYLYVLNEGPTEINGSPQFVVLFPSPTANGGSPLVNENREIQIPEKSWIIFDEEQGTEKLWMIFSANAIPEFEKLKLFATAQSRGVINNPDLNREVQEFLRTHSGSAPVVVTAPDGKQTSIKTAGNVMVHLLRLEHH